MKHLLLLSAVVFASISTMAQSRIVRPIPPPVIPPATCPFRRAEPARILARNPFKIKLAKMVSSETARVADYVEFKTMEKIYSDQEYPDVLFEIGTPIYAVVTWRKHRAFPFRRGRLEIALEPLVNWDGAQVHIGIKRHGSVRTDMDDWKLRNKPCERAEDWNNCIAGRRNARVAPVVPAVAGAGAIAVGALAKDDETRFIAATSFFSIAKELGDLLNGTDAMITENEIFDLYIEPGSVVCTVPEKPKPKPAPPEPIKVMIVKPSQ